MQLLTSTSHHFFRYNTTTVDWNSIKISIDLLDVIFACLAVANLDYGLFGEPVKGFSLLPISNTPEDPVVVIYYGQYGKLVVNLPTFDCDCYNKDVVNVDENNDGRAANVGVADDGVVDDRAADNDDNQEEGNDQNSDGDDKDKQREFGYSRKGFFLDKTRFPTLITSEKALLNILEKAFLDTSRDVKPETVIPDVGKKLTQ